MVGRTPLEKARALDTTATIIISCRRRRSLYVASSLVVVVARLRHSRERGVTDSGLASGGIDLSIYRGEGGILRSVERIKF